MLRFGTALSLALSLLLCYIITVHAQEQDAPSSSEYEQLIAEHTRRRNILNRELINAKEKIAAYEAGESDIPESTYSRYVARAEVYLKKLQNMDAMEESEIISLRGGSSTSRDL